MLARHFFRHGLRRAFVFVASAVMLLSAVACGGASTQTPPTETRPAIPTPLTSSPALAVTATAVATPTLLPATSAPTLEPPTSTPVSSLPPGWKDFKEGAFSGAVPQAWDIAVLDAASLLNEANPVVAQMSPENLQAVQSVLASGRFQDIVFAFVDHGPDFATNINMLGCFSAFEVPPEGKAVDVYAAQGIKAEDEGAVEFDGRDWRLTKIEFSSFNDSYEVTPHLGSCYIVITLSVRPGDTSVLPDFRKFVQLLHVDESLLMQ